MKTFKKVVGWAPIMLLMAVSFTASPLQANAVSTLSPNPYHGFSFYGKSGYYIPSDSLVEKLYGSGLIFSGGLEYVFSPKFSIASNLSFWQKSAEESIYDGEIRNSLQVLPLTLSYLYRIPLRNCKVSPYIGAGTGICFASREREGSYFDPDIMDTVTVSEKTSETTYEFHGVGGLDFFLLPWLELKLGARYSYAPVNPWGMDIGGYSLYAGLIFFCSTAKEESKEEDSDGDGFPDWWEEIYGFDKNNESDPDPNDDPDKDGKLNSDEHEEGTDPNDPDTDGDGITDGEENKRDWDSTDPDMDNDDKTDGEEDVAGTNPREPDSDHDGYTDGFENKVGSDPNNKESTPKDIDGDGLTNKQEKDQGTDPRNPDTDGDGTDDRNDYYPLDPEKQIP